jgi:hypothetical protein
MNLPPSLYNSHPYNFSLSLLFLLLPSINSLSLALIHSLFKNNQKHFFLLLIPCDIFGYDPGLLTRFSICPLSRVTRLGETSPTGRFYFGKLFFENYWSCPNFRATFSHRKIDVLLLTKIGRATFWAEFLNKLIWSPCLFPPSNSLNVNDRRVVLSS